MTYYRRLSIIILCAVFSSSVSAQEEQDTLKIYTQEVRLPVVAYDDYERFDPTLAPDDILVLEDGVPQRVRSVRRVPANIPLVFDLGGQVTGTRHSHTTREAALRLIKSLRAGDRLAIIQNSNRVELLQDWTSDLDVATQTLTMKFFSSNRSRLSECLTTAASTLKDQPVGNTHIVVFTDGLEAQTRNEIRAGAIQKDALRNLIATQASVHLFGYAALIEDFVKSRNSLVSFGGSGTVAKVVIDTDVEMRRWFKNYARATKQREEQLTALAQETGGRILLPSSTEGIIKQVEQVSRDIEAQYVVTYAPKRLFEPTSGAVRPINVFSRRIGLRLFSLRSHVVAPAT